MISPAYEQKKVCIFWLLHGSTWATSWLFWLTFLDSLSISFFYYLGLSENIYHVKKVRLEKLVQNFICSYFYTCRLIILLKKGFDPRSGIPNSLKQVVTAALPNALHHVWVSIIKGGPLYRVGPCHSTCDTIKKPSLANDHECRV